jgi:hypothetical protein
LAKVKALLKENPELAGRILVAKGNMISALTTPKQGVSEFPKDYCIWTLFGEAHIRLGDEEQGKNALLKSLELNADYAPTYLWLAAVPNGNPQQLVWLKRVLVI